MMNFKKLLPDDLYQRVTTAHPYRFSRSRAAGRNEVRIDKSWSLLIDSSCGPLTKLVARDLLTFMRTTFGVTLRPAKTRRSMCIYVTMLKPARSHPESYQLQITKDQIDVIANGDEAGMRALFYLQRIMLNIRGPILHIGSVQRDPVWSTRITGPLVHQPIDEPQDYLDYPANYLLNMARFGYNATYIYLDLFDYISPDVESLLARKGYRQRIRQLGKAAQYLQTFGIRLLFHLNTLALPTGHQFFRKYPSARGAATWVSGRHCLCSGSSRVLKLYRESVRQIFRDAPALGGIVLIVGGECLLHCYSRPNPRPASGTHCRKCAKQPADRVVANVVNVITQGVKEAKADAQVFVWPYSAYVWGNNATQQRLIKRLDRQAHVLAAFAKDRWISVDGTRSYVYDYSICQTGPSPRFNLLKQSARKRGVKMFAKTEASQSIEMFTLPRLPIMHRWADRAKMLRDAGVDGVHTTWRFYGFCAQMTDEIIDHFAWEMHPDAQKLLRQIAQRDFGLQAAPMVLKAWRCFSNAFAYFPYSVGINGFPYFRGPFFLGPAHPMVFDLAVSPGLPDEFYAPDPCASELFPDGDERVKHSLPKFFVDAIWTQPFGPAKTRTQLVSLERRWAKGVVWMNEASKRVRGDDRQRLQYELDLAIVILCTTRTAINLLDLQQARQRVTASPCTLTQLKQSCLRAIDIVKHERANAAQALEIVEQHESFGFVSTYGRAYDVSMIQMKLRHCDQQITEVIPRFYEIYASHAFADVQPL